MDAELAAGVLERKEAGNRVGLVGQILHSGDVSRVPEGTPRRDTSLLDMTDPIDRPEGHQEPGGDRVDQEDGCAPGSVHGACEERRITPGHEGLRGAWPRPSIPASCRGANGS